MNTNKKEILESILNTRRRLKHIPSDSTREVDIFEEQLSKSLKRIDQISYLSKKFSLVELADTLEAYEQLLE